MGQYGEFYASEEGAQLRQGLDTVHEEWSALTRFRIFLEALGIRLAFGATATTPVHAGPGSPPKGAVPSGRGSAGPARARTGGLRSLALLAGILIVSVMMASQASAHTSSAYSNEDSTGGTHTDWMAPLPDGMPLSQLSIPGTHDTGAFVFGRETTETQAMGFTAQLNAGIRAWDIRLGRNAELICAGDELYVFHGFSCQNNTFNDNVLPSAVNFLSAHPGETILMRVRLEHDDGINASDFAAEVQADLNQYPTRIYAGTSDNPTLGEVRGKIVILQNFTGPDAGVPWGSLDIQDKFNVGDNWDLADKWGHVRKHFEKADTGSLDTIYLNHLSASGGAFPYFIASGHSSWETGAPRLLTGWTRGVIDTCSGADQCLSEYPSVNCFLGTCSVAFEGTNILAMNYINRGNIARRTGIVMADFPGDGLISALINLNPWNLPPTANAGGPYTADEASPITFDASGSVDPDQDALEYRWDVDGNGSWDTPWSSNATHSFTWNDDHAGAAFVEVSDGFNTATDSAAVTVNNVDPTVTADGATIDENGSATVTGTITDPSPEDTFTVVIDWGEGTPVTYTYGAGTTTFSEEHQYRDDNPTGTPSDDSAIDVTVTDDDGGTGTASTTVTVNDVAPFVTIDSVADETGSQVGVGDRLILTELQIDLAASFTDVGSEDTHVAAVDWGDGTTNQLGATTGSVTDDHVYASPGTYTVLVSITDDDTLVGTASHSVTVVDAAGALTAIASDLTALLDDDLSPEAEAHIVAAIGRLIGENGGSAENGARDLLARNNYNASLRMIVQALEELDAEAAAGGPDRSATESLLALTAKSVAVEQIEAAEAAADKGSEHRKVAGAQALVEAGDDLLAGGDYMGAASRYQAAVRTLTASAYVAGKVA